MKPLIHVVCWDISRIDGAAYEGLYAQVSPERRARADRYRHREDAVRCVAAEVLVRRAAKERTEGPVTVVRDEGGKPRIQGVENFRYNISHAGRWVVIAWGESEVGVDVEKISMDTGKEKLARRFFTEEEQAYVFGAEGPLRAQRFFHIWTGKESYLKYLGTGLRTPLNAFSVLSLEGVFLHRRMLPGGYCLTLCAEAEELSLEIVTEL